MAVFLSQQLARWRRAEFSFSRHTVLFLLVVCTLISGCNSPDIYMDDRYNPPVYWGRHVVQKGDSLYKIAWRYGRDFRELADANGVSAPYTIRPGQVIRLDVRGNPGTASQQPAAKTPPRQQAVNTPAAKPPAARPPATKPPVVSSRPQASPSTPDRNKPLQSNDRGVASINWRWPFLGPVIATFSTSGVINKGIDIAGEAGDPIRAAADGEVVYAGNGLLGYGELIIVNHNERFLSAYAHNRKILVREGERIRQGQQIAELGATGTSRNKLHFEIRKDGNPVDPMAFLPPR